MNSITGLMLLLLSFFGSSRAGDEGDGLYDPDCEPNGLFKAKQCNSSDVCWCVDGVGVRRTHNGDRNLRCEEFVGSNRVLIKMKHKEASNPLELYRLQKTIARAIQELHSNLDSKIEVKYDVDVRLITMEVKKNDGNSTQDLSLLNYYMEKDASVQSLFSNQTKFESTTEGEKLEMESIMDYYVEEKEPTNSMKPLTAALLTISCVFILIACAGLLLISDMEEI